MASSVGAVNVDNVAVFVGSGSPTTTTTTVPTTTTTVPATTAPTTTTTVPATTTTVPATTTVVPGGQVAYVELEDAPNNLTFESAAVLAGTGRGSLGYWYTVGQYSRATVTVPGGTYLARYRYASPEASTRTLLVDGVAVAIVSMPATGGWGNAFWRSVDVSVSMVAGAHTLELQRTSASVGAVNLDNLTIFTA